MLYTVSFYRKLPHNGKMEKVTLRGVASWQDEASSVDPYTLRVIRDAGGNVVAGPMLANAAGSGNLFPHHPLLESASCLLANTTKPSPRV